jgi:hypothetical protein
MQLELRITHHELRITRYVLRRTVFHYERAGRYWHGTGCPEGLRQVDRA